jgi:hypothetical protein
MLRKILVGIASLMVPWAVHAGYGIGTVGQVLVGRLGDQVYVELLDPSISSWPCGGTHPNGFRYAFLLSSPGGEAMLSTVLTAQASGKRLQVVGAGVCTIDATVENVTYVILQPT